MLIVKTEKAKIPSDFDRVEYISYNRGFKSKINKYLATFLSKLFIIKLQPNSLRNTHFWLLIT